MKHYRYEVEEELPNDSLGALPRLEESFNLTWLNVH